MRRLVAVVLIVPCVLLTSCSASQAPGESAIVVETPQMEVDLVRLETVGQARELPAGTHVAFDETAERWLRFFAGDSAATPSVRAERNGRRRTRSLRRLTFVAERIAAVIRPADGDGQVVLQFTIIRDLTCTVSGLSQSQCERLLSASQTPVRVVLKPQIGRGGRASLWMEIMGIEFPGEPGVAVDAASIRVQPDTQAAYAAYGRGLALQRQGDLTGAVEAFEAGLALDGEATMILNHYAFFLATTQEKAWQDPAKALVLSLRALQACQAYGNGYLPDILDTVARAYYETGDYATALGYAREALAWSPRHRDYIRQMAMIKGKLN